MKSPVKTLALAVALWMVRCCYRFSDVTCPNITLDHPNLIWSPRQLTLHFANLHAQNIYLIVIFVNITHFTNILPISSIYCRYIHYFNMLLWAHYSSNDFIQTIIRHTLWNQLPLPTVLDRGDPQSSKLHGVLWLTERSMFHKYSLKNERWIFVLQRHNYQSEKQSLS